MRQCNLTGRFLFFIPGIRTINALELPTNSFYAMNNAIQRFQAIGHMRGGRISGFLGRSRDTFYLTKVLRDVRTSTGQGVPYGYRSGSSNWKHRSTSRRCCVKAKTRRR